ncbi:MAG: hypothetical protein AB3N19_07985 [Ruegeria sp.]
MYHKLALAPVRTTGIGKADITWIDRDSIKTRALNYDIGADLIRRFAQNPLYCIAHKDRDEGAPIQSPKINIEHLNSPHNLSKKYAGGQVWSCKAEPPRRRT